MSLVTAPPPRRKVAGLTYATADEAIEGAAAEEGPELTYRPAWRRRDAVLSILLVALVGGLWIDFSRLFF